MRTQTIEFATVRKDGVIQTVGRSTIIQPKTNYKGGETKWLADKPKQKTN